jgi:hypothetical protein
MSRTHRFGGICLGLAMVLGATAFPLPAQEPAKSKGAEKSVNNPARRVPPFFNKVGISAEQREKIYSIRAKHQAKIAALRKQLEEAQDQELAECEGVLTETQKKLLVEARASAKSSGASGKAAAKPADDATKGGK